MSPDWIAWISDWSDCLITRTSCTAILSPSIRSTRACVTKTRPEAAIERRTSSRVLAPVSAAPISR